MNTRSIILLTLATVSAITILTNGTFTQGDYSISYTDPLKYNQINLNYKCFTPTVTGCETSVFGGCDGGCRAFKTQVPYEEECVKASIDFVDPSSMFSFKQNGCKVDKPKTIKKKFEDVPSKCFVKTITGKCCMDIKP